MRTWAIGDVHGCLAALELLLDRLDLDPASDRLWLTGDLVNRGPDSLRVLRWARETERRYGDRFAVVLGNHDLHAIAVARRWSDPRRKDTLDELLGAPDGHDLLAWLAARPLLHRSGEFVLVHAGVLPEWSAADAAAYAARLEAGLLDPARARRLLSRPENGADVTDPMWRALAALTRMRALTPEGDFCEFTGPPEETPVGCLPWFECAGRRSRDQNIVFGHWAAVGLRLEPGLIALDSGCFWGGSLSAVCLEEGTVVQQENPELQAAPRVGRK